MACLVVAGAAVAQPAHAPDAAADAKIEATVKECFRLRDSSPAAAIAFADKALAEPLPFESEVKLQSCLSRAAALAGDAPKALAAVARIDAMLASREMPADFQLRALSTSGAVLHLLGHIPRALDYYVHSYELARNQDAVRAQVAMLINVAEIYSRELGAHERAETFYARAQALQERLGTADAVLDYDRGINQAQMGRAQAAAASFDAAIAQARKAGQSVLELRARAERLALQGDASVRPKLQEIAERQEALQDPSGAATTLLRSSALALSGGDAGGALDAASAAAALVAGPAFPADQRDALLAISAAQQALGRWHDAYESAETLRRMETERLRAQNIETLAGLQARLQDTRSAEEIARLRDEKQAGEQALRQSRWLRDAAIAAFAVLALLVLAFTLYQRRVTRRLQHLSTVDALTGLLNRGAASERLRRSAEAADAGDRHRIVLLIDVDHFKAHNDRDGHAAGDAILVRVAQSLRACCREDDVVARWGGEEFLVGTDVAGLEDACKLAERIRSAIPQAAAGDADAGAPPTVSIGFAPAPFFPDRRDARDWQMTLRLADWALYAAKHDGRDAWVGLWGRAGVDAGIDAVLADPVAHAARGHIDIVGSRQAAASTGQPAGS